jgi:hypothetical protein
MIYREVENSVCRTTPFEKTLIKLCAENIAYASGAPEPNQDMRDIAALVHRTPALASPHPHYGRMNKIIRRAAASVDKAHPNANAKQRAEELIYMLRWRPALVYFDALPVGVRKTIRHLRLIATQSAPWLKPLKKKAIASLRRAHIALGDQK